MLSKKQRERQILDFVYHHYSKIEVKKGKNEKPDFWLKSKGNHKYFGVEITERYDSGSSARLANIPSYASELIAGKPVRHKADKENLNITPIEIFDANNFFKGRTTAIIRNNPTSLEFITSLHEIILKKDSKLLQYDSALDHINLIIFDNENSLHKYGTEDFIRYFFSPETKKIVVSSGFREIFFLTKFKDSVIHCMPLKLQVFYNEAFLFSRYLFEYNPSTYNEIFTELHLISMLRYLEMRGFDDVKLRLLNNDNYELFYSGYGLVLDNPLFGFDIRFYLGTEIPLDFIPSSQFIAGINYSQDFHIFLNMKMDKKFIVHTIEQIRPSRYDKK